MTESKKLRVFLSYAHADIAPIRTLYKELSAQGFDVWFDEESLIPGQDWRSEIQEALEHSDAVVICLSNHSVSREGFVQREFKFALDKALEMTEEGIFLIPVRLNDCKVPTKLSRYHWVDLFADNGIQRLMKALSLRMSQVAERDGQKPPSVSKPDVPPLEQRVEEKKKVDAPKEPAPRAVESKPVISAQKKPQESIVTPAEKKDERPALPQVKETEPLTTAQWRSTFFPLWLTIPIGILFAFIQGSDPVMAFGTVGIGIAVALSIISISLLQWNLLRRQYPRSLRWVGINIAYIILSLAIDFPIGTTIYNNTYSQLEWQTYTALVYTSFSLFFLGNFILWLILDSLVGRLIVGKNARMIKFINSRNSKQTR